MLRNTYWIGVHRGVANVPFTRPSSRPATAGIRLEDVLARLRRAAPLVLVLDYDGTLVPLATAPDLAAPDGEVLSLLAALAQRPGTTVHVMSGRAPETLDGWLGTVPLTLHAEHGLWTRPPGGAWIARPAARADWIGRVLPILQQVTELLSNVPLEIVSDEQVIEVRPHEASRGAVVAAILADCPADATVAAVGDGRADEDAFAALPPGGIAIHVGPAPSRAPIRLPDVHAVRRFLGALVAPGDGP